MSREIKRASASSDFFKVEKILSSTFDIRVPGIKGYERGYDISVDISSNQIMRDVADSVRNAIMQNPYHSPIREKYPHLAKADSQIVFTTSMGKIDPKTTCLTYWNEFKRGPGWLQLVVDPAVAAQAIKEFESSKQQAAAATSGRCTVM